MTETGQPDAAAILDPLRPRLVRAAYGMLGSVADAEDAVQEAFIRWMKAERGEVRAPEAYLRRTVARLCLDRLKSARHRRETYLGPWLPDPIIENAEEETDVTLPLMLALERLSPLERAVFLLHDVFDFGYAELAAVLQRSEAACRQLAARAREHVRVAQPRFEMPADGGASILMAFVEAAQSGDAGRLAALLTEDATLHTDGGGQRRAALRVIHGRDRVARGIVGVLRKFAESAVDQRPLPIGGLPGILMRFGNGDLQTIALQVTDGSISAVYVVRNPEKMRHLSRAQLFG